MLPTIGNATLCGDRRGRGAKTRGFFPKALRRVLPCGALGQLAQSSLHRVTSMEISGALGQLAQSSLHRVTSMEISGALGQLAQSSLHRVTSMEIPAWRYLRRVTSTE